MSRAGWLVLVLVVAGCGAPDPEADDDPGGTRSSSTATANPSDDGTPTPSRTPRPQRPRTVVTVGESPFGPMLFDGGGQAIYLFEPEADGRPACYDACEDAWPPVLTSGRPAVGDGLRKALVGTVERRDGRTQVTYGGWPLYFYAHEDPGQVLCHDVVLNGGLWLAVGPEGNPLPS